MRIIPLTSQKIKVNDKLLICGNNKFISLVTVQQVKKTAFGEIEIIFDKKSNYYMNLNMYLKGKSKVKECFIIKP